jgi:acetyltransferase
VLASPDDVYDAAIRRAGMLRVYTTEQLFAAVETLARAKPLYGDRLAILGNGAGPVVLALDALQYGGGHAAVLQEATVARLRELVPEWRGSGPLNLRGDAPPERYRDVVEVLLHDPGADAVLMIHAPNAVVDPADVARAVAPLAKASSRNVLGCWLGGSRCCEARTIAAEAGMPSYRTPEDAVNGFLQIVHYRANQNLLMQVPASVGDGEPDRERARRLVREALAKGRYLLADPDTKAILSAYGIPVVPTRAAATASRMRCARRAIGYPVAVKILSPDVAQKSDVGGVTLDLDSDEAVLAAAERMRRAWPSCSRARAWRASSCRRWRAIRRPTN